ncbi:MAG: hypothetical protein ABR501_09470 [Pyrinomonadaceae bacterium]
MKTIWISAATVCMITAAIFTWRSDFDTAFVIAALGAVSWFLGYRVQLRAITRAAELEESNNREREDIYEGE